MTVHEVHPIISRGAVRLEDGKVCVFERDGIYQARIRADNGRYLWRSLRTRNQINAVSKARQLFHSIEFRRQNGLPIKSKSVSSIIDEYVAFRERQHAQGRTTVDMLRHVRRISKFWRKYIGNLNIETIGNKELSGYIEWRKAYYSQLPSLPKNAKLNPTDKTLQWEMHGRGKSISSAASFIGNPRQNLGTFRGFRVWRSEVKMLWCSFLVPVKRKRILAAVNTRTSALFPH